MDYETNNRQMFLDQMKRNLNLFLDGLTATKDIVHKEVV